MTNDLNKTATRFEKAYDSNTKAKAWLTKQQITLFDTFTTELAQKTLQQRTVTIPPDVDTSQYILTYHPGWRLVDVHHDQAVIEEDPSLMKYTYVNPETNRVYGRTRVEGSPSLDDERLQQEDPELWARITVWPEPWYSLVRDTIQAMISMPWSNDALDAQTDQFLCDRNIQRVLIDFNTLSHEDLTALQKYLIPGPITTRLVAPRNAKPEDYE